MVGGVVAVWVTGEAGPVLRLVIQALPGKGGDCASRRFAAGPFLKDKQPRDHVHDNQQLKAAARQRERSGRNLSYDDEMIEEGMEKIREEGEEGREAGTFDYHALTREHLETNPQIRAQLQKLVRAKLHTDICAKQQPVSSGHEREPGEPKQQLQQDGQ